MYIFAGTLFGKRDDNIEYKSKNDTLSQLTIEMLMEQQCWTMSCNAIWKLISLVNFVT